MKIFKRYLPLIAGLVVALALWGVYALMVPQQTRATTPTLWELITDYGWTRSKEHKVGFSGYFPGTETLTLTLENQWNAVPESIECWYETSSNVFAFVGAYTPSDADGNGILDTVVITCTSGATAGGIYRAFITTYDGI